MPMNALAALFVLVAAQSVSAQSAQKPPAPAPPARSTLHAGRPRVASSPASPAQAPAPSPFLANRFTYAPHYGSPSPDRRPVFPGFSPMPFGYGYTSSDSAVGPQAGSDGGPAFGGDPYDATAVGQQGASGSLYLDVEPRTAQVFVDGFYMGTVDDFRRMGVMLPAGRHWIDLRAPGHEPLTIPVHIAAGQSTRYRGDLIAVRTPPAEAVPPRGPETMYVIPGCYAGNKPPLESALARGCDLARLHILN